MLVIIEVLISVIAVYLVFSVIVYVIVEWIAGLLHLRGGTLKDAIEKLFKGTAYEEIGKKIFEHPQISSLKDDGKLPSYIPSNNIAVALIDLVKEQAGGVKKITGDKDEDHPADPDQNVYALFKEGIRNMDQSHPMKFAGDKTASKKTFLTSISEQTRDLKSLTAEIENWYNAYMDRVSGWYKRNIRKVVLVVGIVVTLGFNIDSIYITRTVATNPAERERMNRFADALLKDSLVNQIVKDQRNDEDYYDEYKNDDSFGESDSADIIRDSLILANTGVNLERLEKMTALVDEWKLPIGWNIKKDQRWWWTLLGWFITALALSAGAPFWFDMLKRLVNLRNSGAKPEA